MTSRAKKKITALIPCYNEENSIGAVIRGFPHEMIADRGFELEIVVIDNNSKDRTAEIAREHGATVIHEEKKGKGNAMRTAFYSVHEDTDYVVMLDGDDTYRPQEILRLIEPIDSGFCDVIVGSRLGGRISSGSMTALNRAGNWIFSHLVRYFYRVNVTDVLTGYFAWSREALLRLRPHLSSSDFAIEMEMITKMARMGEGIYSVPISYDRRAGQANLRPFYDGSRILRMFVKNLAWRPAQPAKQKIAFVSDAVFPYSRGGKETRLSEISRRLANESGEIHIYTMQWWEGPQTLKHDGVFYHALCGLYPLYSGERRSIRQAIVFGLSVLKLLFVKFDVIDVDHMPLFPLASARLVTWARGKKLYATWHEVWGREYWLTYMKGFPGVFGYMMEYLTFLLPDTIISNSAHTTRRLIEAGVRCPIKTVPLGVDIESISEAERADIESDIVYVGRLLSHKSVNLLVRALRIVKNSVPDIKLLIIGDGPEKTKIEELIANLGLQEHASIMSDVREHRYKYGLMKASKMLVSPSVREGFGLVVIEAHAAGIPVITTSHEDNASKDLIHDGIDGFICEPTETDIANAISKVLKPQKTLAPRRYVSQYDWKTVVRSMEEILQ